MVDCREHLVCSLLELLQVQSDIQHFLTEVDLRPEQDLIVEVSGWLDTGTGVLRWRLRSIDPETGALPEDPLAGFLPPNVTPPEGDGRVMFTVMPKAGLASGTEIGNGASIVFDVNDPIDTPAVLNTIDAGPPSSGVSELPSTTESSSFVVAWSGADDVGGSGIGRYDVYVSDNGGPFALWQSTEEPSATWVGEEGHTYGFYSVAVDRVGHREPAPAEPHAVTTVPFCGDPCAGPEWVAAVSRRTHGQVGVRDIDLPLDDAAGVGTESRAGGPTRIVLTFSESVRPADGSWDVAEEVILSAGAGTVSGAGDTLTLELGEVADGTCLTIRLAGITDMDGNPLLGGDEVTIAVLRGDVNGDGIVDVADMSRIKGGLFEPLDAVDFRADVSADGVIDVTDMSAVKGNLFETANCP